MEVPEGPAPRTQGTSRRSVGRDQLPDGWAWTPLGEIAREVREHGSEDQLPVLSMTKYDGFVDSLQYFKKQVFSRDTSRYKVVRRGQFAYATIHLDEGSIDLLDSLDAGLISPMYTVFEPNEAEVNLRFLRYLLKSDAMVREYPAYGQGSINRRKSIGFKNLAKLPIPLPPLPEQRRIAEILTSVDEAIQATEAVIEQTERVKKGLLQQLLTRGIGHTRFKQTEIGEIPEGWQAVPLESLLTLTSGYGFSPTDWTEDGLPIIRIQNLNGSPDFNHFDGEPDDRWLVEPGELLFAWAGVRGVSFGPCIWPGPPGVLNQHIYRVRENESVSREFLYLLLLHVTRLIERQAHGFKASLVHVRRADITAQRVPLPPTSEQGQAVRIWNRVERARQEARTSRTQLRHLNRGLAQALMAGRVLAR